MGSESKAAKKAERERLIAERQELEKSRAAMTPEERQRDLVRRQAENFPTDQSIAMDLKPEIKKGSRGGRYTQAETKDGVPYRRYF